MATWRLLAEGSTYDYLVSGTIPTITPTNLNTIYQNTYTITVTRSSQTVSTMQAVTRYFRIKIGSKTVAVYKASFSKTTSDEQKGTVTKIGTSLASYGDIAKTYFSSKNSSNLEVCGTWGSSSSASSESMYIYEGFYLVSLSGFAQTVAISNPIYYSDIDNSFGIVKGFCDAEITVTATARWTYTAGTESSKVVTGDMRWPNTLTVFCPPYWHEAPASGDTTTIHTATITEPKYSVTAESKWYLIPKTVTKSITFEIQDYRIPELINFDVTRNSSNNEIADIYVEYSLDPLNKDSNVTTGITVGSADIHYQFYDSSETEVGSEGTINIVPNGSALSSLTGSKTASTSAILSPEESYSCKLWIEDRLSRSVTKSVSVPTEFRTLDFKAGGKGAAFGAVAETDNELLIGREMPLKFDLDASESGGTVSGEDADLYENIVLRGWDNDSIEQ